VRLETMRTKRQWKKVRAIAERWRDEQNRHVDGRLRRANVDGQLMRAAKKDGRRTDGRSDHRTTSLLAPSGK